MKLNKIEYILIWTANHYGIMESILQKAIKDKLLYFKHPSTKKGKALFVGPSDGDHSSANV